MKRIQAFIITFLATALSAVAHPLGNFSINQYSRLEVDERKIKIRQILDLAEIPTFQLQSEIDRDGNANMSDNELNLYAESLTPQIISNVILTVNDRPLSLLAESTKVSLMEGAGGLPTLRIEWDFSCALPELSDINKVRFENLNYDGRVGWNEIVVTPVAGISIFNSSAYGSGITDELKAYPAETLQAPLNEREAEFSFSAGTAPNNTHPLQNRDGHATVAITKDRLAELIAVTEITSSVAIFGLLLAFGLGAMHALSPGHGKAIVGAYLVGSKGTPKHAAFLGLTVTITHTLGVFALGFITLCASSYVLPEKLLPFLSFISGLLVLYIGLTLLQARLFVLFGWKTSESHHHHDHHHHSHGEIFHTHNGHTHSHLPPDEISWKSLLALGISGGLLPCPSALVLMLSAISLGRVGYGLILTTAFSLGLATTLTAVGLIFLYVGRTLESTSLSETWLFKALPVASAFVIVCLGAIICYQSL